MTDPLLLQSSLQTQSPPDSQCCSTSGGFQICMTVCKGSKPMTASEFLCQLQPQTSGSHTYQTSAILREWNITPSAIWSICRQISISPTVSEALSAGREDIPPYLPANQPDAAHHLPRDCVDRGLDIHFRLLSHDNFQPMFKNVHGLLSERREGAAQRVINLSGSRAAYT